MAGPLQGMTIIELAGLGPTPFCGMMLADAGARIITIGRPSDRQGTSLRAKDRDALSRGRENIALDLRKPEAVETALRLIEKADALIEGLRPGAMEKLGLGPDICLQRNSRLVYGRMTGWGQTGPLAKAAGHDLNYIAVTGALHAIGPVDEPMPPLNLIGDYGGGGMLLAFGICAALVEAQRSGKGQVVDAAMCDGAALLMAPFYGLLAAGAWRDERRSNFVDGAAPFYGVYRCSDGKYISLAPIEPQFYALMLKLLELDDEIFGRRDDRAFWPELRERIARRIAEKTQPEWCALLEGTDVCFAPVLKVGEAASHAHLRERGTLVEVDGGVQPSPAPRFSRTNSEMSTRSASGETASRRILLDAGLSTSEVDALIGSGAVAG